MRTRAGSRNQMVEPSERITLVSAQRREGAVIRLLSHVQWVVPAILVINSTWPSACAQSISYVALNGNDLTGLVSIPSDGGPNKVISSMVSGADMVLDSGGNFILAEAEGPLQRVTSGGIITTIASPPSGSSWVAVAIDASGNFILGDNEQHVIWRVPASGSPLTKVVSYAVGWTAAMEDIRIVLDIHGNYIVAEDNVAFGSPSALHLFSVSPAGAITPIALSGPDIPTGVSGLIPDGSGNYLLGDYTKRSIYRVSSSGVAMVFAHNDAVLCCNISGLARNPATGELVIAVNSSHKLLRVSPDGHTITTITTDATTLS
jgi:hypothetical protein